MPEEKDIPRLVEFEPRLLALFLLIAIPFILIGALFILGSVQAEFNEALGNNMAEVAADTARYLDSYILHNVSSVSVLSLTPSLLDAAVSANRQYPSDGELVRSRLLQADDEWQFTRGQLPLAREVLDRQTSQFLQQVMDLKPAYREILATDVHGALLAATNVTTDYYQADEPWWQRTYGDGENGSIFVSDISFDLSANAHVLEIAAPLRVRTGGYSLVVGVLKALIDAGDLFSVIGSIRLGDTGRALLVHATDGTIITGLDPETVMESKYPAMAPLNEAFGEARRWYVGQRNDGQRWLSGFSRMPEPSPSPELNWFVVVEQLLEEAAAPARTARAELIVFVGAMIALVLLATLYMHFKLVRPIRQIDLREEMERLAASDSTGG